MGGDYSVFRAHEARNLNTLGLNRRVKWEKVTSVCYYFRWPLFFTSFRWVEIRKENDTHETIWISDVRGFELYIITSFKKHARGRRMCTLETKSYSRCAKFKYTKIELLTCLHFDYESNSRPTIHATVTNCILKKKFHQYHPPRVVSFADGLCLPLVWQTEILKNPERILKLFPPFFQNGYIRLFLII